MEVAAATDNSQRLFTPTKENNRRQTSDSPKRVEAELNIRIPRSQKAVSHDKLVILLFQMGGDVLLKAITSRFHDNWNE